MERSQRVAQLVAAEIPFPVARIYILGVEAAEAEQPEFTPAGLTWFQEIWWLAGYRDATRKPQ